MSNKDLVPQMIIDIAAKLNNDSSGVYAARLQAIKDYCEKALEKVNKVKR